MGNDIQKGTTYATGGAGGQGSITSSNLNAHVDDATIKSTFISAKADRAPGALTDNIVIESGGALYKMLLSTLQPLLVTPSAVSAGTIIQTIAATVYTANTNITTVIPNDDTAPQISEGTQILTLNISLWFTTSVVRLEYHGMGSVSGSSGIAAALFRTGNVNALQTSCVSIGTANFLAETNIDYLDVPGSLSTQTYSIRVGPTSAVTARMNGTSAARLFGGTAMCTLVASEIKV